MTEQEEEFFDGVIFDTFGDCSSVVYDKAVLVQKTEQEILTEQGMKDPQFLDLRGYHAFHYEGKQGFVYLDPEIYKQEFEADDEESHTFDPYAEHRTHIPLYGKVR